MGNSDQITSTANSQCQNFCALFKIKNCVQDSIMPRSTVSSSGSSNTGGAGLTSSKFSFNSAGAARLREWSRASTKLPDSYSDDDDEEEEDDEYNFGESEPKKESSPPAEKNK